MGFEDFAIRPGDFTKTTMFLNFKLTGHLDGESCTLDIYVKDVYPDGTKNNYQINGYSYYNIFILRYDGTEVKGDELFKICKDINWPNTMVSGPKSDHFGALTEEHCCELFVHLQCNRLLKGFVVLAPKKEEVIQTGPCAKCGCNDKYNSPSPHFNNEVRCYIHWA